MRMYSFGERFCGTTVPITHTIERIISNVIVSLIEIIDDHIIFSMGINSAGEYLSYVYVQAMKIVLVGAISGR